MPRTLSPRRLALSATISALALPLGASAQTTAPDYFPNTSADLLALIEGCQDDACMSYVSGVIGGIAVYALLADNPSPFCTQGDVGKDEIRQAIVDTIKSTEALKDQHAALAVLTAFGRYWPCLSEGDLDELQSTQLNPVDPLMLDELLSSGGHALVLGDPNAGTNRTLVVFHDPNCPHCRRFRNEMDILADAGWKVMIFPVATSAEESAGYGAVEVALRDQYPDAVRALHDANTGSVADITVAMKVAESAGVPTKEILEAVSRSDAYAVIEANTLAFFEMGAQGTPAWIIGNSLYSGYLTADAIQELSASFEAEDAYHIEAGDEILEGDPLDLDALDSGDVSDASAETSSEATPVED